MPTLSSLLGRSSGSSNSSSSDLPESTTAGNVLAADGSGGWTEASMDALGVDVDDSPTNYTAADDNVASHLAGIDAELGQVKAQLSIGL